MCIRDSYDDVCVDAEARRMGVGKALMQYAEDYAKECGCYNIELLSLIHI